MKIGINSIIGVTTVATVMSCSSAKKEYASFELYPVRTGSLMEMEYTPEATKFTLWSPTAEEVRLMLYDEGEGGHAYETVKMELGEDGTWATVVNKNLLNKFYTFNVKINDKWQGDTPGINAHAVGVNGKRAAIIDWKATNPEGWENDQRPPLKSPADMIIYEMHHRDFSVDSTSGIVKEFKQMVQALHKAGIRVILDVVYNHTFNTAESNFERTVPGYFYRQKEDGTLANGSGCGNETASERPMMRKFMIESVLYWMKEYHIDGFRFDLMGVHDIETMNEIRKAVDEVDSTVCVYGEGWAAETPQYPVDSLAMKKNVAYMPGIAVFSDEFRDGLCGSVWEKGKGAFLAGVPGGENSVKFGIVGAIEHPQVRYDSVNYSRQAWAGQPTQMISYVSCHDGLCLVDRLKASMPEATPEQLVRLDKLAQTVVFTSQGIPFIYAGEEVMRDKQGVDNSYKSPDAVNAIDWRRKTMNGDVFMYYKRLIDLRKSHPAFRMGDAEKVRKHLEFLPVEGQNLIAFRLKDHANGDSWEDIIVAFNSRMTPARLAVPAGKYTVVCKDGVIDVRGLGTQTGTEVIIPGQSALIMYR